VARALAVLLAATAAVVGLGACGAEEGPQGGVAPRGATSADAGVTNGAISYTTRDLAAMMADRPSEAARLNAASRAVKAMAGEPLPPTPRLDPLGVPDYFGGTANWANSPPIRKFVDSLPGVGAAAANDLGQYIPVAVPDTTTYPGSDYYEIAVREYSEKLHRDLPATRLRGYVQTNAGTGAGGENTVEPAPIHYLGPLIDARRGRPVRIRLVNQLPSGEAGKLFLPVDSTITGAGTGPLGGEEVYPQNRASLHLHGGLTPWISGGSQYQWVAPAGERSPYRAGPGLTAVPDMPDPGPGATTLYFPNDQSARFLCLRSDTFGLTRLSVYAGEAAPYFIGDPVEDELIAAGTVPAAELPLIIEDKTFVPDREQLREQDPTWDVAGWGGLGALWYPHVYMPNQNGTDVKGRNDNADLNAKGRWDYLPWYWKGYDLTVNGPVANPLFGTAAYEPEQNPGTPNPSVVPSAFHDTMLVNGTAYPYTKVERKAYRLRILNACGDRSLNLQLYYARSDEVTKTGPGGAPELQADSGDISMLPAVGSLSGDQPVGWPTDGRTGGVPDPGAAGPDMIQIGNDGGLLPQAVQLPSTPVGFTVRPPTEKDSQMGLGPAVVGITTKTLFLAPGERADVIVDFSQVPSGSKLILYNDAPAPAPSGDSRLDYYTGDLDLRAIGGAASTVAGYGPNTRTILQFQVEGAAAPAFDLDRLRRALPAAYAAAQDPVLVPTAAYDAAYGLASTPDVPVEEEGTLTFAPLGRGYELTLPVQGKMVAELFDPAYGRKTATLGVEAPLSASGIRTSVPYSAIDPATEYLAGAVRAAAPQVGDGTQLWRITHDGIESHSIHFGGMNVQVLARATRDGAGARAPDPGELGWKDTVRVDPLESVLVAVRPVLPRLPFKLEASRRTTDVTRPPGATGGFTELDPVTAAPHTVVNAEADFSWEASWSIHLPGGEESHTVRPLVVQGSPQAPDRLSATAGDDGAVTLRWTRSIFPPEAIAYVVERAGDEGFRGGGRSFEAAAAATSLTDDSAQAGRTYFYRVRAEGERGFSSWSAPAEVTVP
jgi:FtsP/CotA-like multicopper oxidase with cupredoxin domain